MYKIGEFSLLARTTIKTLRYYEKEHLLVPKYIDTESGYRYYDTEQLISLTKIVSLRQIGLSIEEIKKVLNGANLQTILLERKSTIEENLSEYQHQLTKINYLLEERKMKYEVITKNLPEYTVYYKDGLIKNISEIVDFILSSAEECRATNPDIKCITPDYCYVNYLDKKYLEKDLHIRYAQAVEKAGIPNETINFMTLESVDAVCLYHKGSYEHLPEAYSFIMKYIEDNNYEIIDYPRERYIDGMWNKESEEDWLTEIQIPVKKK